MSGTTTTSTTLTPQATNVASTMFNKALEASNQPYSGYTGPATAPLTGAERYAASNAMNIAGGANEIFGNLRYNVQNNLGANSIVPGLAGASGNITGLAGLGSSYLPMAAPALQRMPQYSQFGEQMLGYTAGTLPTAAGIAGQGPAYMAALPGVVSNLQDIASQGPAYTTGTLGAIQTAGDIANLGTTPLASTDTARQQSEYYASMAPGLLPIGQQAAGESQRIASLGMAPTFGTAAGAATSQGLANLGTGVLSQSIPSTLNLAQTFPQANISAYMNPYVEQVLDPALQDISERAAVARNQLASQAARTGSFGGSRNALAQSELERNTQREMGRLSALERANAFNQGANQFRLDQTMLPGLYSAALGQLGAGQGLQQNAANLTSSYLQQLAANQGLQQGASNLAGQALGQIGAAQGIEQNVANMGTTLQQQLANAQGLQRGAVDIGTAGLGQLAQQQALQSGILGGTTSALNQLGQNLGLQRGVADIAGLGIGQTGAVQGMDMATIDAVNKALQGVSMAQGQNLAAQQGMSNVASERRNEYRDLSDLLAANQGLLGSTVSPLLTTGALERAISNAQIEQERQNFAANRDWPLRNIEILRSVLGTGGNLGSTTTATRNQPTPDPTTAQYLGMGIAGLSALPNIASGVSTAYNTISRLFGGNTPAAPASSLLPNVNLSNYNWGSDQLGGLNYNIPANVYNAGFESANWGAG